MESEISIINGGEKEGSSMAAKKKTRSYVVHGYGGKFKNPEETEKWVFQGSGQTLLMKRYKGIWRRRSGEWVARTRDPINNVRVFLGTFDSAKAARKAYFYKRVQFEAKLRANESHQKHRRRSIISSDVFSSVAIDNHGFLLGEFSRLDDDLWICR